ncbi:MAG: anaerobic ribonucleoside-triphosphate reductase activating protein [Candidatus Aminicenantes bacterium]|nr:MAG: anaerobic ribonucleoside-triphosphate reductase activating protein [Candidatus Aminicenantes bacterium]
MVEIKGLEKFSPKDFPGYISSTVFLGGCNFRCPFCHNSDLVLRPEILPTFPLDYFLSFLDSRKGWLEGICISGGEPLLQDDLETLLILIKDRNLLVKIDTNGSFPSRLENLIQKKLVDHIAMDVKAPLKRYQEVTRATVNEEDIVRSVDIIKNSGLGYVFRTTLVPGLVGPEDIKQICQMLKGAKIFQLQQFVPLNTLDSHYLQKKPYRREEVQGLARIAEPYFSEVRIEGV